MKSREERIEYIKKVVETANKHETKKIFYTIKHWRNEHLYRKIVQIDSEFLMFRIENSRTEIQQLKYVRDNSLPKDFFNDPESPMVQEAQESILFKMAGNKGLLDDLRNRKQDDACIITFDGYIVNGNRRTAGLKFLGERYVSCVVLPEDATPKDIYLLEQQLQISQDFKEDYHWINELRNIKRGKEDSKLELSEKELASNLREDLKDIRVKLRMLSLVDSFLFWKNIPGEYDYPKLDKAEEIFRQLEKGIKKYSKDPEKMEALQKAVFNLLEERPTEIRLYKHVGDLIKNFEHVLNKVNEPNTFEVTSNQPNESNVHEGDNLFDDLFEKDKKINPTIFENPDNASETTSCLIEIIADINAENREKKDAEAVYESVSSALRELQGLTIDNDTSKLGSIKNKLEQIISSSQRLLDELKSFED